MLLESKRCWLTASFFRAWTPRSLAWAGNHKFTFTLSHSNSHSKPHQKFQKYTDAEEAIIIDGRRNGQNWDVIASRLDRPKSSVEDRFYKHLLRGNLRTELLKHRKYTLAEDRSILRLKNEQGCSIRDIAQRLGRSAPSIETRYRRYLVRPMLTGDSTGITFRRPYTASEIREIVRLREQQRLSFGAISICVGRVPISVQKCYYRYKPSRSRKTKWYTNAEDERLLELRSKHGAAWKIIAQKMFPRSVPSLEKRFKMLEDRAKGPV